MFHARRFGSIVMAIALATTCATVLGQAQPTPEQLWDDFNHYVLIARPDLALAAGTALRDRVNDQQLLDIAEKSDYDWQRTLLRAARTETLREMSNELSKRLLTAQLSRAREPDRIDADIERLGQGERPRQNAIARLREAGQFTAPHFLKVLQDQTKKRLHPYVLTAMVELGRPLVYPLSESLLDLEPVTQGQVAQVLAEIGYPRPLPYMKAVIENPKTDPAARDIVRSSYDKLAAVHALPEEVSAAELFLLLGENLYSAATDEPLSMPGYDTLTKKGIVWRYDRSAGLVSVPVPGEIFGDVLAMDSAYRALDRQPDNDRALSLWLMANLRRENRLLPGYTDPSYPGRLQPAAFYLKMSGPLRQHDVLARALRDHDAALALDAIAALDATAGTDALVNREGTSQPLLWALQYPDRRVRFRAAIALTHARPKAPFEGSQRVVPALSEAVRQSDVRYAVVIAADQDTVNKLAATVREMGYTPIPGTSLQGVAEMVRSGPGVDLIVTRLTLDGVTAILRLSAEDFRLATVPVLAIVTPGDQIELERRLKNQPEARRVFTVAIGNDADMTQKNLSPAADAARQAYAGQAIDAAEAEAFALEALTMLREVALTRDEVFNVGEAQPALIQALADRREKIVERAGSVLSLLENDEAQAAIADAALDPNKPDELRISLLGSLAESATYYGNRLNQTRLDKVLELVRTSRGDLAEAAARAHGALSLPTSDAVQLIVAKPKPAAAP
jgi:hypothetical protein